MKANRGMTRRQAATMANNMRGEGKSREDIAAALAANGYRRAKDDKPLTNTMVSQLLHIEGFGRGGKPKAKPATVAAAPAQRRKAKLRTARAGKSGACRRKVDDAVAAIQTILRVASMSATQKLKVIEDLLLK
jgi:hypothetical protein